jgi:hypothetical protein
VNSGIFSYSKLSQFTYRVQSFYDFVSHSITVTFGYSESSHFATVTQALSRLRRSFCYSELSHFAILLSHFMILSSICYSELNHFCYSDLRHYEGFIGHFVIVNSVILL